MNKINIGKLFSENVNIVNTVDNSLNISIALKDLFALGCHFHAIGHETVGWKCCETALRAASITGETEKRILKNLSGMEIDYARSTFAHAEVKNFMDTNMPGFSE